MLIEYEKGIKKNKQKTVGASSSTPQFMAIQGGRVQKKPHGKAKVSPMQGGRTLEAELSDISSQVEKEEEWTNGCLYIF
nr:hypothetical protein [Tanacetum cinerariifolium]